MNYWLMKSEPDAYSIDDLKRDKIEFWDGIRNYQARNMMRDGMQKGDLVFFYHSNTKPPGIVGVMQVCSTEAYPDHTQFNPESKYYDPKSDPDKPRWLGVDMKYKKKFKRLISLDELRQHPELETMVTLRKGNRLSITPVEEKHWDIILKMAE
tara:strand:- start:34405 stop:34863 length:459 start_codon:yes stop_codon:yes gene_type:complete